MNWIVIRYTVMTPIIDGIFKLLGSPVIDSKESIPPAYVAWRINQQYDNPILTRFLAPIDCSKIPALDSTQF
jgi:hypothetical protein